MPQKYKDLVFDTYTRLRDDGALKEFLPKETTARLKKAALKVYDSRYSSEDADILSSFFDVDKMDCDFRQIISSADPDDFKALWKHIRGITENTNEENSDFLAWLIDFKPRPSIRYYKNLRAAEQQKNEQGPERINVNTNDTRKKSEGSSEKSNQEKEEDKKTPTELPPKDQSPRPEAISKKPSYFLLVGLIVLLILNATGFMIWNHQQAIIRMPHPNEKCMYWKGDHFEPVSCDVEGLASPVIALNLKTLKRQRKILLPDTLTSRSLGKVWYSNIGKKHEFFTYSGIHPIDTVRQLRPVTGYILNKYVSYHRFLLYVLFCAIVLLSVSIPFLLQVKKIRNN